MYFNHDTINRYCTCVVSAFIILTLLSAIGIGITGFRVGLNNSKKAYVPQNCTIIDYTYKFNSGFPNNYPSCDVKAILHCTNNLNITENVKCSSSNCSDIDSCLTNYNSTYTYWFSKHSYMNNNDYDALSSYDDKFSLPILIIICVVYGLYLLVLIVLTALTAYTENN